jgi:DNA-binding IclR family transcriptional regulator
MTRRTGNSRTGTQSIERAVRLMRALATRGHFGWRLVDLCAHCDLDKGTTHRVLATLVRERLVQQRARDRRYLPGPLLFELGLSVPVASAWQTACSASLARIAKRFGAVAMLYLRSGDEFVCAARAVHTPLKALTIEVGTRRPLIVSAGGVAMLVALPPREARQIIARNMKEVERFGSQRVASIRRVLRNSRARGFGVSQGEIVPRISAFGVSIVDLHGDPYASISVVATTERLSAYKMTEVVAALRAEAQSMTRMAGGMLCRPDDGDNESRATSSM